MSNTFRDVVKSNLLKNCKPVKFRKREIISERLNETLGGLATEITLTDVTDNVTTLNLSFGDKKEKFEVAWKQTDNGWHSISNIDQISFFHSCKFFVDFYLVNIFKITITA